MRRVRPVLRQQAGIRGHRGTRPDRHLLQASGPQDRPLPGLQESQEDRSGLHPAHPEGGGKDGLAPQDLRLPAGPLPPGPLLVAPLGVGRPGNRASGGNLGPRAGDSGGSGRGYQRKSGRLVRLTGLPPARKKAGLPASWRDRFLAEAAMPRRCALSGKSVQYGNNVSHANNKTRRRLMSNLQVGSVLSDALGHTVRLRITPRGMKTIEHNGGIDAYLLGTNNSKLSPEMKVLKRRG